MKTNTTTAVFMVFYLFGFAWIFTMVSYSLQYDYMPIFKDYNPFTGRPMVEYVPQLYISAMIIFTLMLADFESKRDDFYIRHRLRVNHTIGFIRRLSWMIGAIFIMKQPIEYALPLAGLFSITFNRLLNWRRNKEKWYISQSNHYDRFFIWIVSSPWYSKIRNLFPQRFYFTGSIMLSHAAKIKLSLELFVFSWLFWNPIEAIF